MNVAIPNVPWIVSSNTLLIDRKHQKQQKKIIAINQVFDSFFFFFENKGHKKNQEIIGWSQILLKISFDEIAPKCILSNRACHKNITEVLSEIDNPLFQRKLKPLKTAKHFFRLTSMKYTNGSAQDITKAECN